MNCQGCADPEQVVPVNIGFYIAPLDRTPIDGKIYEPGTKVPIVLQLCPGCRRKDLESRDPFVRGIVKLGRNEPCPCGSGKKFKKCCQ